MVATKLVHTINANLVNSHSYEQQFKEHLLYETTAAYTFLPNEVYISKPQATRGVLVIQGRPMIRGSHGYMID